MLGNWIKSKYRPQGHWGKYKYGPRGRRDKLKYRPLGRRDKFQYGPRGRRDKFKYRPQSRWKSSVVARGELEWPVFVCGPPVPDQGTGCGRPGQDMGWYRHGDSATRNDCGL